MDLASHQKKLFDAINTTSDESKKKEYLSNYLNNLPLKGDSFEEFRFCYDLVSSLDSSDAKKDILFVFISIIPRNDQFEPLYIESVDSAIEEFNRLKEPRHRKSSLLRIADEMPQRLDGYRLYIKVMKYAIVAADQIDDKVVSLSSLIDIIHRLEINDDLSSLCLHAYKVALELEEESGFRKYSLEEIAKKLPKSADYEFYQQRTFLGVTCMLPKKGEFLKLFIKAIKIAIEAVDLLKAPYYKYYSLDFIAKKLPETEQFLPIYKDALNKAFEAVTMIGDQFSRQHCLFELIQTLPKTMELSPLLLKIIEQSLPLFSMKSRLDDMEIIDVIDYVIVAEERKMNDSKKRRYTRGKYAYLFSVEIEKLIDGPRDVRLIEVLKPYSHIWVRPKKLRDSIKKLSNHLINFKDEFHGKEIERPVFVKEKHADFGRKLPASAALPIVTKTISIDIGATNTVVMQKIDGEPPEFVDLAEISKQYGDTHIVPTLISPETESIGVAAQNEVPIRNIKKLLLEGSAKDAALMERFLRVLYRRLKGEQPQTGWFTMLGKKQKERICMTAPIGFQSYKDSLLKTIKSIAKNMDIQILEEPLAAAIGYEVAEKNDKLILVFDFGGCTLDVMLLRLNIKEVHVVAKPDRSTMLGGNDIDKWITQYLASICGINDADIPNSMLKCAEEVKIGLSEYNSVPFEWDGKHVCDISRDDFEAILAKHHFYDNTERAMSHVLRNAKKLGIKKSMIEAIILTGGSSQIPSFKEQISYQFPSLSQINTIYDHSPLTAVAYGAAMYGTAEIIDRHLGAAYAVRHLKKESEGYNFSYDIVLEKGEPLPFEKTFLVKPAKTLGSQNEIYIELFEVPEVYITRRWVNESGVEFIKQIIKDVEKKIELKPLKVSTLTFKQSQYEDVGITFCVDDTGGLKIKYGKESTEIDTGLRLQ